MYNVFMSDDAIIFKAEISKIQTMADGGLRFIFDAGEKAIKEAAMLMECKRRGIYLNVEITEHEKQDFEALNEVRDGGLG